MRPRQPVPLYPIRPRRHIPASAYDDPTRPTPIGQVGSRVSYSAHPVRLVIARCTVDYDGRLQSHLPSAVRLIMVKADGCVAIHSDGGAYKPLNWMNAPNRLVVDPDTGAWRVSSPGGQRLTITVEEILHDSTHEFGGDPGLRKDGVEAQMQQLLAVNPAAIEDGLLLVRREYPTAIGPVDMLCRDTAGAAVAVEIKRHGEIDGVEQLTRYLHYLNADPSLAPVRGVFVARTIKHQARVLASDRSIDCVEVDYDELRGIAPAEPRLF